MFESEVDRINKGNTISRGKTTYSIYEIQQILNVSRPTVYKLIQQNLFRSIRIHKSIRIFKDSFDKWLDS